MAEGFIIRGQDLVEAGLSTSSKDIRIESVSKLPTGGANATLANIQKENKARERSISQEDKKFKKQLKTLEGTDKVNAILEFYGRRHSTTIQVVKAFGSSILDSRTQVDSFGHIVESATSSLGVLGRTLGQAFNQLTIEIHKQIETFRNLSEAGVQFAGGLFGYRKMAIDAGVSLEMFQNAVHGAANTLALFGGNALIGTQRFSKISGDLQKDFGPIMNRLGIRFEEQIEYLADYLDIQVRLGHTQGKTNRELQGGAERYILQLDQLSRITGKQRDEIARSLKDTMADKSIAGIFQALEAGANENLRGIIGALEGIEDTDMKKGMQDLIATGGLPLGEFGKSLVLLNPSLQGMAKRARDGEIGVEEFAAAIRQTARLAMARGDEELRLTPILAQQGNTILSSITAMRKYTQFGVGLTTAQQEQQIQMEENAKAVQGLQGSFQRLANALLSLLEGPIRWATKAIDAMASGLEKLTRGESSLGALAAGIIGVTVALGSLKLASIALRASFGLISKIPFLGGAGKMKAASKVAGGVGGVAALKGGAILGGIMALVGAGLGAGLFLAGKGLGVVAESLEKVVSVDHNKFNSLVESIKVLSNTDFNANFGKFSSNMATFASSIEDATKGLDTAPLIEYTKNLTDLNKQTLEVQKNLGTTTAGTGKVTGDKLDSLNSTMNEILMVLTDNTKYARITSKKDFEGNLMKIV